MTTNDSTAAILSERRWHCAVPRRRIGWVGQPLSLLALALWTSISSRGRGCRHLKTCVEAVERSSRVPKASGELRACAGWCWWRGQANLDQCQTPGRTTHSHWVTSVSRPAHIGHWSCYLHHSLAFFVVLHWTGVKKFTLPADAMAKLGLELQGLRSVGSLSMQDIWCVVLTTHSKKKNPESELLNQSRFSLECGDPFLSPSGIF